MQTRSATMLTSGALVEEKNILAPILGEIIQDKEKKKRKKQTLGFEDEHDNLEKEKGNTREEEEEEELQGEINSTLQDEIEDSKEEEEAHHAKMTKAEYLRSV
eukprot:10854356-Ditylum_brightwellii.AAC.1